MSCEAWQEVKLCDVEAVHADALRLAVFRLMDKAAERALRKAAEVVRLAGIKKVEYTDG